MIWLGIAILAASGLVAIAARAEAKAEAKERAEYAALLRFYEESGEYE